MMYALLPATGQESMPERTYPGLRILSTETGVPLEALLVVAHCSLAEVMQWRLLMHAVIMRCARIFR